jgi:hypothetical protein
MSKIADFDVEPADGQPIKGDVENMPKWPCIFSGATDVEVKAIKNDQEEGYSATWRHAGTSYEVKWVKKLN